MSRKNKIMERIECTLRFDPQQQAEQLQDMINAVDLLDQFGQLLYCVDRVEAEHRGRLLQFLLEQVEILSVLLGRESKNHRMNGKCNNFICFAVDGVNIIK